MLKSLKYKDLKLMDRLTKNQIKSGFFNPPKSLLMDFKQPPIALL